MLTLLNHLSQEIIDNIIKLSLYQHVTEENVWQKTGASDPELGTFFDPTSSAVRDALATKNLLRQRLATCLQALSAEQRIELTALMWLGRADADLPGRPVKEAFKELCDHARRISDDGDILYLMEKPPHDYLRHAMTMSATGVVTPYSA
jgi:hypothetical protein